jgi:hypothetical protein
MSIPTFVAQLGEYMLLDHNVTKVLEDVRDTVVKEVKQKLLLLLRVLEIKTTIFTFHFCLKLQI